MQEAITEPIVENFKEFEFFYVKNQKKKNLLFNHFNNNLMLMPLLC